MTAVREERRLVTCMFVDVVGSTELTMRLGAERLKRELGNAFAEISGIITAHGGTVEKYIGDAIYALFGAPIAHEDDPVRALRAAEAMQAWCLAGAGHGHPFTIRVGIETGEAVVDLQAAETTKQQMSIGAVVNIAARLQQRAEPGEILVGPTLRGATESVAELEPLGDADLKGIGRMPVWRFLRVGAARARALPFVGRDAELGLLAHAFQRASKGRSVLAVVSGPPGQGKTRLVQEFLSRQEGCRVVATRCRPADEVGVFAPVRDVLGVTTLDALAEQIGRICTDDVECERVVAGLAESAGIASSRSLGALPAAERDDEIAHAWRRYVSLLGADLLVVVAVDDIHWADTSLVRLVDRITFNGPRVLVIATARPEFAEAAGIRPTGDRFFIELEGLEHDEARHLAAMVGRDDDRVVERAEGNPLFLVELARAERTGDQLPITLQGALGARLDQLPPNDRVLLSLAAVAGERSTAADAAFLAARDLADATRALTRLVDLHFLDQAANGYRFHHGLMRDAAYGRLLSGERMRAHARFARERVHPEDVAALAYHWWEALRPPDGEWVWENDPELPAMRREAFRALLTGGRSHADHFATDTAIELLDRARMFAPDDADRAEVERSLASAYRRILRQDEAWTHLKRALELLRASGNVPPELYRDLVHTAYFIGAFREPPTDEEVQAIADAGVAAAHAAGDRRLIAQILRLHAGYLGNRYYDDLERVPRLMDAAVEAAEVSGDPESLRAALFLRSRVATRQGRPPSPDQFDEFEPRGGDALERMNFVTSRALNHLLHGDLEAAQRDAETAVELSGPMGPHNRTHALSTLAEVAVARGDWAALSDIGQRTARLVRDNTTSAFCDSAADAIRDGAIARALTSGRDEALALLRDMPTKEIEVELKSMLPRALLGQPFPEADERLAAKPWLWWDWRDATLRALILGRPDDAEKALDLMGAITLNAAALRAFAEGVREAIAELRGGPPATHEALRRIGYLGWIELLRRRADAEY